MFNLFQTDTDAGPSSSVGVGVAEQVGRTLQNTQANWLIDGHGLRGPQKPYQQENVQPAPMQLPQDSPAVRPGGASGGGENCKPPSPDTSKVYVKTAQFISGAWKCVWEETCDATCP